MPELREFASSANGDHWFLGRDDETMHPYVLHRVNGPSGGKENRTELDAFMSHSAGSHEREALLLLIGTLVEDSIDNIEYTEG